MIEPNYHILSDPELRSLIKQLKRILNERSESKTFSIRVGRLEDQAGIDRKVRDLRRKIQEFKK